MHKFEEKYQGFENQNNTTLEINIPSFSKSDVPLKYVGNHRIIKRNGLKIVWTLGPHWPCFTIMFTILTIISFLSCIYVAPKYSYSYLVLTASIFISFLELYLYMFTSLTNPGLILPSKETSETNKSIGMLCSYCNAIKIKRSYHCKECDACIKDWDHHCVWTGKCIGEGNINYFWAFLACTAFFLSYHSAITLGVYKEL